MADDPRFRVQIRPQARRDLEAIWSWGAARWSHMRATRYLAALNDCIERIRQQPLLYPVRTGLPGATRLARTGSHFIAYRIVNDTILIVRVLHVRQNRRHRLRERS
jgi:toxin ParE1/3/4